MIIDRENGDVLTPRQAAMEEITAVLDTYMGNYDTAIDKEAMTDREESLYNDQIDKILERTLESLGVEYESESEDE
ncbi:MAG: hypothetical protein RPU41_14795 [Candidatus Sedimenticola sp. (ex Thyasira tokunagai)]